MTIEPGQVFQENILTDMGSDSLLSRIEAVLFLSREPVSSRRLAILADAPEGSRIRSIVKKLNSRYEKHASAFRVYEVAGGFQLRTRHPFASWLARLHQAPVEIHLSSSALETLAIIAWQQPVLRSSIEKIRGVQCGEMLRLLLEQGLVKIVGKSNDLGRPFLYETTREFLHIFGLNHLEELL
ncbi:MAG: SMC-Scp complex subunit ScpB [Planctomycetaceae bacterium]|nr:SMC-Scp complex subunit ScpB [Planctomycetaceae bacterium]